VNARELKTILRVVLVLASVQAASAESVREATSQGNKLYAQGNFNEAINQYDQALVESPQALEPKFDKANSYYRLDDLSNAMDLYRQVATESKDMKLVAKAKYNLGNTYFQQGSKQKDSDPRKAIKDMETAISSWRGALDIEPKDTKAAKNIEVARLTIKDLIDQLNKQKKDPNQPQDPNQAGQQKQQKQQQQQGSQQDPNQPQKQKQQASKQDPNQPQDPNQADKQKQQQQKQQQMAPDTTAQQILDREQRQRKQRQTLNRAGWQKVDKDW
jgi:Ca-activated chloride channel family protein